MAVKDQAFWQRSKQMCSNIINDCQTNPSISLISSLDQNCRTRIQIENKQFRTLFDSGAGISCISEHAVRKFYKNPVYESAKFSHIYGVCGEIHSVLGTISISFLIDGFPFEHSFHVFGKLHEPVILGRDFLVKEGLHLDFQTNTISRPNSFSMPITIALLAPDFLKLTSLKLLPHM